MLPDFQTGGKIMSLLRKLDKIIIGAIKESAADSLKDMGKVMRIVMLMTKGAADGKLINQRVKEMLEKT